MKLKNNHLMLLSIACVVSVMMSGCVRTPAEDPIATQLQTREIQTRDFDTNDTKMVMKSMMNVLQDEGFIIKNAVMDLGLLSAEKNIDIENKMHAFAAAIFIGPQARLNKLQILEASANVSEFGPKTRVRINFQTKTMDNFGCPKDVITIKDPSYYQIFFDKVGKGIFIQEQEI